MYEEFPKTPCRCQAVLEIGSKIRAKLEQHCFYMDCLKTTCIQNEYQKNNMAQVFYLDFIDIIYGMVKFHRLLTLFIKKKKNTSKCQTNTVA